MSYNNFLIKKTLDTSGLTCPEPVMLLHKAVRESAKGDCIKVIATDPSTQRDIPKFCEFLGHDLLDHGVEELSFIYIIRKKGG